MMQLKNCSLDIIQQSLTPKTYFELKMNVLLDKYMYL
jgi:hypothetical protein